MLTKPLILEEEVADPDGAASAWAEGVLRIGPLVSQVRSRLLAALDRELQPFGITGMHFAILKNLADGTCGTAADLCRLMHYDNGSMTRLLDRLEHKGLVRRERSVDDRRVVALHVTSAGHVVLPRLRDSATQVVQRMLNGFNLAEVSQLQNLLTRMIQNGQSLHED